MTPFDELCNRIWNEGKPPVRNMPQIAIDYSRRLRDAMVPDEKPFIDYVVDTLYDSGYHDGWNDCIKEMLEVGEGK